MAAETGTGKTRFRTKLEQAKAGVAPCIGQWIEFPGYNIAKVIAGLGNDWVLIDCEHGNIDDQEMYHSISAIVHGGSSPIVRIPGTEPWMIKRALDAGAHGLMVPMCDTKEQAEAIVRAAKYPNPSWQQGVRGIGTMFGPALFNQNAVEYLKTANENITVIVQIESRSGLENCEDIAKVPGIDALFIGPNDLASSLGYFAFDHPKIPEVQEAAKRVLKAAVDAGKYAGHFALNAELAAGKLKEGFHFVNYGSDLTAIEKWLGNEREELLSLTSK
ncbi:putative aldolase citrate lyase family protein [Phaeomoniella chlamydospora]|uniref:Putative aldolase citrate lyase family protein n=1 Tax=Phaeomoniella chlamydospora TaxID=158046 RepID=A0A0G2ER69_PHACM|nr:putative aldolase citrate lyase family protein [Phaeomoniella chlamydospora]